MQGIDEPDRRGRTGLDRAGLGQDGNPGVVIRSVEVLSCDWYVNRATTYDLLGRDGIWRQERRETHDRGNGATILLYDQHRGTVLLTRQFRLPAYVNGHPDGMLLETAAGLLDADDPETAVRRETVEETGVLVGAVEHVFDAYMSPGSVTERVHFFAAPYEADAARGSHHGREDEGELIETVELPFVEALDAIGTSIIDGKTIMLLQWAALRGPFCDRSGR